MSAIVCVGESAAQRHDGEAFAACAAQIAGSLPRDVARFRPVAVAYEPLWAIGSGDVPAAGQIGEMHRHLRASLILLAGSAGADIRILYGGSVTADNAGEILGLPDVGGVLVGGASLLAADFNAILRCLPERAPVR